MNLTPRQYQSTSETLIAEAIAKPIEVLPIVLKLKPRISILDKLEELARNCPVETAQLNAWKQQVPIQFFENLNDEMDNGRAQALSFLISQIVHPLILVDASYEILRDLIDMEDELKSLLEANLPKGVNADEFIDAYTRALHNQRLGKQKERLLAICFQRGMEELCKKPIPPGDKLESLLKDMQDASCFTVEEKAKIAEWAEEICPKRFNILAGNNMKETASIALCYLLCNILHPAQLTAGRGNDIPKLAVFENGLREILTLILPDGEESIESFITTFQLFSNEEKLFKQKLALIEESFQNAIVKINLDADATDLKIIAVFNLFKDQLLALKNERGLMARAVQVKIDTLVNELDQIIIEMSNNGKVLVNAADRKERQDVVFKKCIQQSLEIFRGFKV